MLFFQTLATLYDQNERASTLVAGNVAENAEREQRETKSRGDSRC